ncbi:methyltransferase [Dactylosporangium sp. CA-152071]|uniref:methyltransferase n=1 Tax=Dactylosporangium sp. CA-152071 TaxID=3239933 RepID=UPI003D927408
MAAPVAAPSVRGAASDDTWESTVELNPTPILDIASGARRARLLFAAADVGVFGALAEAPATGEEVRARLGLHREGVGDLLAGLEALGLVERRDGRYHNGPAAGRYLVPGRPEFLGGFLDFLDHTLHPAWDGLATSLRSGEPANAQAGAGDPYAPVHADPTSRTAFFDAMDVLNAPIGAALAELDWSGFEHVVDVGGARGNIAVHLVKAHPHLRVTVFDLPDVRPAFEAHVVDNDRVTFAGGDFFTDPLPAADAVLFGHVLHNWPVERRRFLAQAAFRAVRPGGAAFVYDPMLDPDRPQLPNVLASLNMLVWSAGGAEYTFADAATWFTDAGFATVSHAPLVATTSLLTARKE